MILCSCSKQETPTFFSAHQGKIFSGDAADTPLEAQTSWVKITADDLVSIYKSPSDQICRESNTLEGLQNNAFLNFTSPEINTPEILVCSGVNQQGNTWFRTYEVKNDALVVKSGEGNYKEATPLFVFTLPRVDSLIGICPDTNE